MKKRSRMRVPKIMINKSDTGDGKDSDDDNGEGEEVVVVQVKPAPVDKEELKKKLFEKGRKKNMNSLRKQAKWNESSYSLPASYIRLRLSRSD